MKRTPATGTHPNGSEPSHDLLLSARLRGPLADRLLKLQEVSKRTRTSLVLELIEIALPKIEGEHRRKP